MALVDGVNCGFVLVAPTTDPSATTLGGSDEISRDRKSVV